MNYRDHALKVYTTLIYCFIQFRVYVIWLLWVVNINNTSKVEKEMVFIRISWGKIRVYGRSYYVTIYYCQKNNKTGYVRTWLYRNVQYHHRERVRQQEDLEGIWDQDQGSVWIRVLFSTSWSRKRMRLWRIMVKMKSKKERLQRVSKHFRCFRFMMALTMISSAWRWRIRRWSIAQEVTTLEETGTGLMRGLLLNSVSTHMDIITDIIFMYLC